MAIYLTYLLLVGIQFWYAGRNGFLNTNKGKARLLMICCGELILLATLRGFTVGADTKRYLDALVHYSKLPKKEVLTAKLVWPYDFEQGYFLLVKLCALINMPRTVFLLLVALVIYIPVFYTINWYSKIPYISILAYFGLGFFAYSLGIFRQMMALSIVLCGLRFIGKKQLGWYLITVALASTFHTTVLLILPLYFLTNLAPQKYMKWILPAELVCLVLGRPIVVMLVKLVPQYAHYLGGNHDSQGGTYLMLILLNALLFAMIYLHSKGYTKNRMAIAALTMGVLVQSIAYSMGLLGRAVYYFTYFAIFVFAEIAYIMMNETEIYGLIKTDTVAAWNWGLAMAKKYKISLKLVIWVLFCAGLTVLILMNLVGNKYVVPYTFFFMK